LVSPAIENGILKVGINSDQLTPVECELILQIIDFAGEEFWQKKLPLKIEANSSETYFSQKVDEIVKGLNKKKMLLKASLLQHDQLVAQNILYFLPVKELDLPVPKLTKRIDSNENGIRIALTTDRLAKNVFLSADEIDGFFSDNYFDLLPGETITINFTSNDKRIDFERKLKIKSLVDSY